MERNPQAIAFRLRVHAGLSRAAGSGGFISIHYLAPNHRELACVFFRDIEERKRLQNLQQEFVGTVSHELRTPMTVIREGVSQVLEGLRGDVSDSQKRALTLALNGIDRLGRIIDELLDISKIESGKATLKRERIDLALLAPRSGCHIPGAGGGSQIGPADHDARRTRHDLCRP